MFVSVFLTEKMLCTSLLSISVLYLQTSPVRPAPEITQERSVVIMTTQFKIWMVRGGIWVVIKFVKQFIIFREKRKL